MNAPTEVIDEKIDVVSEGLRLEGRFSYSSESGEAGRAVLLLPPHPFLGGDIGGNVVRALSTGLAAAGFPTLTFNYRGIGASQTDEPLERFQKEFWEASTCPDYEKKIFIDARAALRTLKGWAEVSEIAVVGYSFGCLPALELAAENTLSGLCLISPPLAKWPLASRPQPALSMAFVYSPGDFACPEDLLLAAFAGFSEPKRLFKFGEASHFFVGMEKELSCCVSEFLLK